MKAHCFKNQENVVTLCIVDFRVSFTRHILQISDYDLWYSDLVFEAKWFQ